MEKEVEVGAIGELVEVGAAVGGGDVSLGSSGSSSLSACSSSVGVGVKVGVNVGVKVGV